MTKLKMVTSLKMREGQVVEQQDNISNLTCNSPCHHLPPLTRRMELFRWLKELANAPTAEAFQLRLKLLQESELYLHNLTFQTYLQNEWLSCTEQWAAHCRLAYHGGINTNNYMEAMNRVVKTKWLRHRPDHRLDSLLKMWVEEVVPYYAIEYARDNTRSST